MRVDELCQSIRDSLPGLFECALTPRDTMQVRTPMLYPDGGIVDVYVRETSDYYVVTDYGDALGWLRMQSASGRLSPKQRLMLDDVVLTQDVDLDKGELKVNCRDIVSLGEAVQRVAQAVVRVSDLWFTFRTRRVQSVADEVDDWLRQRRFEFERSVRRSGRSGLLWTVDYQVITVSHTSLIFLLSSGSRAAARRVSEHVVAGCIDLIHLTESEGISLVSLFDDTSDVWQPENFNLAESVSRTVMWSRPDDLERVLTVS